jgi:hypothetical protein
MRDASIHARTASAAYHVRLPFGTWHHGDEGEQGWMICSGMASQGGERQDIGSFLSMELTRSATLQRTSSIRQEMAVMGIESFRARLHPRYASDILTAGGLIRVSWLAGGVLYFFSNG